MTQHFIKRTLVNDNLMTQKQAFKKLGSCVFLSVCTLLATSTTYAKKTHTMADHIIAVVDTTPILKSELTEAVLATTARLQSMKQPMPSQKKLEKQVLDGLIIRASQMSMAERSGQRLSEEAINRTVSSISSKRGITVAELKAELNKKQPNGYKALRKQIREEMTLNELRNQALRERVVISEQDVDYFLRSPESQALSKNSYHTYHIRITLDNTVASQDQKAQALVVAEKIKADLSTDKTVEEIIAQAQKISAFKIQGGDMGLHAQHSLPPYLRDAIISLNIGESTQPVISADGIHIAKLVDKKTEKPIIEPQWLVRHVLIKPNTIKSLAQAEQEINDMYEQLRKDADFNTLASTYSDDPGSARQGGSLGWVSTGQMVKEFDQAMVKTVAGDFSTPFQTQFGWHILKVEQQRQKDMTNEYKRQKARKILFNRMSQQAIEDWIQESRSEGYVTILDPQYKDQ